MPTMGDLATFGKLIYGKRIGSYGASYPGKMDPDKISSFQLNNRGCFSVWSGEQKDDSYGNVYARLYQDYMTQSVTGNSRGSSGYYAMCVEH